MLKGYHDGLEWPLFDRRSVVKKTRHELSQLANSVLAFPHHYSSEPATDSSISLLH